MQNLQTLQQFIKLYGVKLNPELISMKYFQTYKHKLQLKLVF